MAKFQTQWLLPLLTFVLGLILGQGFLWEWLRLRQGSRGQDIQLLEQSSAIRAQMNTMLLEAMRISPMIDTLRVCNPHLDKPEVTPVELSLTQRMDLLGSDIVDLEGRLASLEGREPRKIEADFAVGRVSIDSISVSVNGGPAQTSLGPPPPPCPDVSVWLKEKRDM